MKLFTSNYARHGKDPNAVCISVKPPFWYKGKTYFDLAPTWNMVNGIKKGVINEKQYTEQYLQLIEDRKLDANKVAADLGDGAIMLCYESPNDFCHRHIAAIWLQNNTTIPVYEHFYYTRILQQEQVVDKLFEP